MGNQFPVLLMMHERTVSAPCAHQRWYHQKCCTFQWGVVVPPCGFHVHFSGDNEVESLLTYSLWFSAFVLLICKSLFAFLTYSADVSTAGYALQMFFPNLWLVFSFIASYWAKFINLISSILASFYIMVALPVCCLNEPKKSSKNETFPFCKSVFSLASKNLLTVLL